MRLTDEELVRAHLLCRGDSREKINRILGLYKKPVGK